MKQHQVGMRNTSQIYFALAKFSYKITITSGGGYFF